jgi:hypothetical protein
MRVPELIYCADGNRKFAEIAIAAGFKYGAQVPNTVYFEPFFCDQDWKKPNRERYISALAHHKPHLASVLDWEQPEQLSEVLGWAEDAAPFVDVVMIIPKVIGGIVELPRLIGGKPVRLGYSVPTKFSGTQVPIWEFQGWPVHLLGGSPKSQFMLAHYLNVASADGNMHQKMATKHCAFFTLKRVPGARNHPWPTLKETNRGVSWGDGSATADAPYEAFRRSCENIMTMWQR